jgi:ribonuclease HI
MAQLVMTQMLLALVAIYHNDMKFVVRYRLPGGTITDAEILGLELILRKAIALGIKRITIYGDSEIIIKCCSELRWLLIPSVVVIWNRIVKLMKEFEDVELIHIPRVLNKVADAIAYSVCISFEEYMKVGDAIVRSLEIVRPNGVVAFPSLLNVPFYERYFVSRFRRPTFPVPSNFPLNSTDSNSIIFDINSCV